MYHFQLKDLIYAIVSVEKRSFYRFSYIPTLILTAMKNSILTLAFILTSFIVPAQSVLVTFEVNMSYQIKEGNFNPQTEFVDVAGTFNGWGDTLDKLTDQDGDSIWTTSASMNAGTSIEFKFRIDGQWNDREEFPGAGNNRFHTVGSNNETLSYWYNDEQPATGPAIAGIEVSSSFTYSNGSILFSEDADGLVENYEWSFEGGIPAKSNEKKVSVVYEVPGTYDVTLNVSNSFSEDEIILKDYITVEDRSKDDLAWWNEAVFYEIFVRSFYDSDGDGIGDFQGIIEKLDYLNDGDPTTDTDLGITGIWLMPIHDSPSYHGYDVVDYRSIHPDYGTMDDFNEFLEAAHDRGINVVIDLVLNHTSTEIDWFKDSKSSKSADKRNWYRWSDTNPGYSGPWGQGVWHGSSTGYYYGLFWGGMPDLNYNEPEVKEEIFDITRYWLEEVGIDGFRLDAVKYIKEENGNLEDLPSTHEFWREWVAVTKESNPNALSIGEAWTSTEKIVPYVVNDGIDFCFDFDLGNAILNSVKSGSASGLEAQVNKVINSYPYYQFGTFTTNHDMTRLMNEVGSDEDKVKLAAAIYLTLPGVPFIYYGEEIGMLGQKPDENIRRPMSWDENDNAGFSTSKPWISPASNYLTNNVESTKNDRNSLFNWYRKLIQLRSSSNALRTGDYYSLNTNNESVYGFQRIDEGEVITTLINFSSTDQQVVIDASSFQKAGEDPALVDLLSSDRVGIKDLDRVQIVLEAKSAKVFQEGNLTLGTKKNELDINIYPNPTKSEINLLLGGDFNFSLLSLRGDEILKGDGINNHKIDVSKLKTGIYLLHIELDNKRIIKKIVIE